LDATRLESNVNPFHRFVPGDSTATHRLRIGCEGLHPPFARHVKMAWRVLDSFPSLWFAEEISTPDALKNASSIFIQPL
jgi:hypothetical protein